MQLVLDAELRRYRSWTEKFLDRVPDDWLYRRVPWTDCTIGWHLGHVAWKLDSYAAIYLDAEQQLDTEWQRRFYGPDPLDPAEAPPPAELRAVFANTLTRFLDLLVHRSDDDLLRPILDAPDGTLLGALANLIFHEGEHHAGIANLVWYFERNDL